MYYHDLYPRQEFAPERFCIALAVTLAIVVITGALALDPTTFRGKQTYDPRGDSGFTVNRDLKGDRLDIHIRKPSQ